MVYQSMEIQPVTNVSHELVNSVVFAEQSVYLSIVI